MDALGCAALSGHCAGRLYERRRRAASAGVLPAVPRGDARVFGLHGRKPVCGGDAGFAALLGAVRRAALRSGGDASGRARGAAGGRVFPAQPDERVPRLRIHGSAVYQPDAGGGLPAAARSSVGRGAVRHGQRADAHAGGDCLRPVHHRVFGAHPPRGAPDEGGAALSGAGRRGIRRPVHLLGNQLAGDGRPDDLPDLSEGELVSAARLVLGIDGEHRQLPDLHLRGRRLAVHLGLSASGDGVYLHPAGGAAEKTAV